MPPRSRGNVSPPAEPATVLTPMQRTGFSLSPARKPERAVSHPAFSRSMQKPQTGLASPPCRTPPGPSAGTRQARPGIRKTPRFRCHLFLFRHVNSESLALAFPIPHLTRLARLFHIAHHGHVTVPAACGGLKPPPAGRLRRADNPSSPAQHRISKLSLHRAPFHVRDAPYGTTCPCCRAPCGLSGAGAGRDDRSSGAGLALAQVETLGRRRADGAVADGCRGWFPAGRWHQRQGVDAMRTGAPA